MGSLHRFSVRGREEDGAPRFYVALKPENTEKVKRIQEGSCPVPICRKPRLFGGCCRRQKGSGLWADRHPEKETQSQVLLPRWIWNPEKWREISEAEISCREFWLSSLPSHNR
ncbi:hypothetical protein AAC387_Pa06g1959 [Persea americana]